MQLEFFLTIINYTFSALKVDFSAHVKLMDEHRQHSIWPLSTQSGMSGKTPNMGKLHKGNTEGPLSRIHGPSVSQAAQYWVFKLMFCKERLERYT